MNENQINHGLTCINIHDNKMKVHQALIFHMKEKHKHVTEFL